MTHLEKSISHASLVLLVVAATGCPKKAQSPTGKSARGAAVTTFPTHFDPGVPLPPPLPANPDKPGLEYLQAVHRQIEEPWHTFLEDCRLRLPPEHALNQATLEVVIHLSIDSQGQLHGAALEKASGQAEFDEAALELLRDAAPYPTPPMQHVSDDDNVHIMWLIARDRRQTGVATANIRHVKWPVARAVPKFLSNDDVTTAASRLLEDIESAKNSISGMRKEQLELGEQVAQAVIRESLRSDDPVAQLMAIETAEAARLSSAAEGLRAIIDTSVDMSVRARAIIAIGAIGDQGAVQLLVSVLNTAKGSGVGGTRDASIAAVKALATLGSADVAESTVLGWFHAKDSESVWAALVVMSEFPIPDTLPALTEMSRDTGLSRELRMAACTALGAGTTKNTAADTIKALRARFDDTDAAVRTACIQAIVRATKSRAKSKFTYWQLIERIKSDRDERARAAAVQAAVALEPGLFHQELYLLHKERSVLVLAALAEALADVPDVLAYKKLASLAEHESNLVRRQAVKSLLRHSDPRGRKAVTKLSGAEDIQVRMTAIRALEDRQRLTELLQDESPAVQRAAFAALVRIAGKPATLERMLLAVVDNPAKSAARTRFAAAWLAPHAM